MNTTSQEFLWQSHPRKLNLGCGPDIRSGYINVDMADMYGPDLVADVLDLVMLPDGKYVEIVAQDVLEHLPRTSTVDALAEWNRLLEVGGKLILRVPSLEGLAALFQKQGTFKDHQSLMQCLFGTQAYTGDFHQTCFTRVLLIGYLEQCGFRAATLDTRDGWLFDVAAIKVSEADRSSRATEALILEAASDEDFVLAAFKTLLRREPDSGGRSFFLAALSTVQLTRHEVLKVIKGSPEYATLRE